jgi:serine/threonine-protein kinase
MSQLRKSSSAATCEIAIKIESEREARFMWPQVLPDRRGTILTISGVSDDADSASLVVIPSGTTERRVIVRRARAGRLTSSGHFLFARGNQIFAAPFDLDRLTTTAEPVLVLAGVASGVRRPLLDVSDSGDLVYVPGEETGNRLVWVTRNGIRSDVGAAHRSYELAPKLSPDGRWIAVSIGTGDHVIWTYSLDTGVLAQLTSHDAHGTIWSPDSRRVAVPHAGNCDQGSRNEWCCRDGVQRARSRRLVTDGTSILLNRPSADRSTELSALNLSDRTMRTVLRGPGPLQGIQFSPDGKWMAYSSSESGRAEVYVTDYPAAQFERQVSTMAGRRPSGRGTDASSFM